MSERKEQLSATASQSLVTREDFVRAAMQMRDAGITLDQIAARFGRARSTVQTWLYDPDLSKQRARRKRYQGVCEECSGPTDGANGRAKAPKICLACHDLKRAAQHGTLSKYHAGCSCEDCRRANREHSASLKTGDPPNHGNSGYVNYGCRCDVCRDANRAYQWLNPEPQQKYHRKNREQINAWKRDWYRRTKLPCSFCGKPRSRSSTSGLCAPCYQSSRKQALDTGHLTEVAS